MGDQVAGEHRRRDAVLVADRHRIHAMTDGFLIGIDEIGICRAYQPFEPRKGFHMAGAEDAAMRASMREETTVLATTGGIEESGCVERM